MTAYRPDSGVGRWSLVVAFLLLLMPFVNILHFALPLPTVFNKSAWLVLSVGALAAVYLWVDRPWSAERLLPLRWLVIAGGIQLLICFVRAFYYNEPIFPINLRFAATMVVYIGLAEALLRREKAALSILSGTLILQGLLVSHVVFINMNFFPSVRLEDGEHGLVRLTTSGFLTRSMLINASVGANHILCAMFALVAVFEHKFKKIVQNLFAFWYIIFFETFCISLLGSRYPIVIAMMIILYSVVRFHSGKSFISMLLALMALISLNLGTAALQRQSLHDDSKLKMPIIRFDENSGSRLEKTLLGIRLSLSSSKNILIGPSGHDVANAVSDKGVTISDNSYAMLMLMVGVPSMLIFFVSWGSYLRRYAYSLLAIFCCVYLSGVLLLTNGLLWESWICSILFTLIVVARYYR